MRTIFQGLKNDLKDFINKIDKFDHKIIRVSKFDFVVKNVIKGQEIEEGVHQGKEASLKEYIYSIGSYFDRLDELERNADVLALTFERRCRLL